MDRQRDGVSRVTQSARRAYHSTSASSRIVERDIGDEVTDQREGPIGSDADRGTLEQLIHPCRAHESGKSVDFCQAGSALAGVAVPPAGKVWCRLGLNTLDDVEYPRSLGGCHDIVNESPVFGVTTPYPDGPFCHQTVSSTNSCLLYTSDAADE